MLVAECFAVTSVNNNSKLREDAKKLMKLPESVEKHMFFYTQNDSEEKLKKICGGFLDIKFNRIKKFWLKED